METKEKTLEWIAIQRKKIEDGQGDPELGKPEALAALDYLEGVALHGEGHNQEHPQSTEKVDIEKEEKAISKMSRLLSEYLLQ